ncbi:hypothetical protein LX32DRAFT_282681 [Colletotrichum zoysiae]|uniref:Uncharacterized protein n=1 Tax=Colletotrichum zoysiae TaxID=1216348 RepID=A0AAD9LWI8_9PEZI|nr:hypothetical protein LX32DRAFT_282681 [Colletotrichum zoysiae]
MASVRGPHPPAGRLFSFSSSSSTPAPGLVCSCRFFLQFRVKQWPAAASQQQRKAKEKRRRRKACTA